MDVPPRDPGQATPEQYPKTPAAPDSGEEVPDHYKRRMEEVEPDLGRRGRWGYLFWVALWLVVLAAVVIIYAVAGRAI